MERNKGITLIALVITIVVLLILAGVSINFIFGNEGIFTKSQYAVEKYKNEQEKEQTMLGKIENEIDKHVQATRNKFEPTELLKNTKITADLEYTLSDSIENYNWIRVEFGITPESDINIIWDSIDFPVNNIIYRDGVNKYWTAFNMKVISSPSFWTTSNISILSSNKIKINNIVTNGWEVPSNPYTLNIYGY